MSDGDIVSARSARPEPLDANMMATDRSRESNGGRYPSRQTLELLQAALVRYLAGASDDEQICEALAVLAREGQERQLHGENMLVAFKQVWHELPEVERIGDPATRKSLLDHLVKLCIDAYYKQP